MSKYRKSIQIGSLILFGALTFIGKVQLWMGIFLVGLILSTFLGRFYCGYLCPINTSMEGIDNKRRKNKKKARKTPAWAKNKFVRYGMLLGFLGAMVFVFRTGKKLPVLPIFFFLGVSLTLVFEPSFWHRYLCPYGTLLSIFSKKSYRGFNIEEGCIRCGICVRNCPSDAITWDNKLEDPEILKNECLVCGRCEELCPEETIDYIKRESKVT